MAELPPLRDVIRAHGLAARKSLGQNFLLDLNLTDKIARAAGDIAGRTVVEVGPGPGGLTRSLLSRGANVVAIERDARCLAALAEIAAHCPARLEVVAGDALAFDYESRFAPAGADVVANLPYNIGTALLVRWLETEVWPPWWRSLTLMFQKEVAERITARPATASYGRLAVLCGWRSHARRLFDVPPTAFVPPPKVVSSVVHITPADQPPGARPRTMSRVTAAAFGQRRKMLRTSLRALGDDPVALLACAGLDPQARAETVDIGGFVGLARCLDAFERPG